MNSWWNRYKNKIFNIVGILFEKKTKTENKTTKYLSGKNAFNVSVLESLKQYRELISILLKRQEMHKETHILLYIWESSQ